jgi:hypothetical protein
VAGIRILTNPATLNTHHSQYEVLPFSGAGKSLILSPGKDLEDGSEEISIEVKGHASPLAAILMVPGSPGLFRESRLRTVMAFRESRNIQIAGLLHIRSAPPRKTLSS